MKRLKSLGQLAVLAALVAGSSSTARATEIWDSTTPGFAAPAYGSNSGYTSVNPEYFADYGYGAYAQTFTVAPGTSFDLTDFAASIHPQQAYSAYGSAPPSLNATFNWFIVSATNGVPDALIASIEPTYTPTMTGTAPGTILASGTLSSNGPGASFGSVTITDDFAIVIQKTSGTGWVWDRSYYDLDSASNVAGLGLVGRASYANYNNGSNVPGGFTYGFGDGGNYSWFGHYGSSAPGNPGSGTGHTDFLIRLDVENIGGGNGAVPEPATLAIAGAGAAALGLRGRLRRGA